MPISKHSLTISGHQTSISMEDAFWQAFKDLADKHALSLNAMAQEIDESRDPETNLCSAIRLAILKDLQKRVE